MDQPGRIFRWGWPQRLAISLNTVAALALAAVLLLMVNYLSARHYRRWDWSRAPLYRLSDKTLALLAAMTNQADVVVFLPPGQALYDDVDRLLREYEAASSKLRVERVDPDRDLARTEELKRVYEMTEPNLVVFDVEGRRKYVRAEDLADYDYDPLQYGEEPVRTSFKAEQMFSSALHDLIQGRRPVVYFVAGHGERDVTRTARGIGYSEIAESIRRDNAEVRALTLGQVQHIPEEADALLIAGPDKRYSAGELDVLREYLERKGRLMVLLDALTQTGLEPLLAEWGVRVADDVVLDPARTLTGRELFLTTYEDHPISRRMAGLTSVLYFPRSVKPLASPAAGDPADRPQAVALARCSEGGWAETDPDQSPMRFDPERDQPGPVPVAVAVEKGAAPSLEMEIRPTRLVVFGDSDFAANGILSGGNADLFLNSLNWLLDRDSLLAISPKPLEESRLILAQPQLRALFWILVAGLPLLAAAAGLLVGLRRRN